MVSYILCFFCLDFQAPDCVQLTRLNGLVIICHFEDTFPFSNDNNKTSQLRLDNRNVDDLILRNHQTMTGYYILQTLGFYCEYIHETLFYIVNYMYIIHLENHLPVYTYFV